MGILKVLFRSTESVATIEPEKSDDSKSDIRWKPSSLNPLVLASVIAFTLFLAVILAILQSKSNQDGGILFSESIDSFPAGMTFLYLYLPTIIAVFYTTIWNWIDLDIKRLEPWYQLSKESGAPANESILLQYPVEFLASVPISSMKRRQWTVFCSSTVLGILFWAVTPLQSGIFAVTRVQKSNILPVVSSPGFLSLEEQAEKLTLNFVNEGYGVTWLGQKPPAFTTTEYALAPFLPADIKGLTGLNQTWTANTTLYSTDLDCQLPVSLIYNRTSGMLSLDDGQGCIARNIVYDVGSGTAPGDTRNITAYYIGYTGDGSAFPPPSLSGAGCGSTALHEFLAVWRRNDGVRPKSPNDPSFTALFCWSKYFEQEVEATVRLPDYSVQSVRPISERKDLSIQVFNYTRFEELIVTETMPPESWQSTSPQGEVLNRYDISERTGIEQEGRLDNLGVNSTSKMTPFALGMSGLSTEALLNPDNLQSAFERAHRMLFALAVHAVMSEPADAGMNITGIVVASMGTIKMVEAFTFPVIGLLFLVATLTVYLLCTYRNRTLNLLFRPDSIAATMPLVCHQQDILAIFGPLDRVDSETIVERLKDDLFCLQFQGEDCQLWRIPRPTASNEDFLFEKGNHPQVQPWPWALRYPSGGLFILILLGSFVSILILHNLIQERNGLPLPSGKAILQQILLNFLPTGLGTLIEPFWLALNRLLCILQPYFEMHRDAASASKSILLEYTSVPPQLAFWRSLSAKHWLLATVCAITAGANILTVGLSGLFELRDSNQEISIILNSNFLPKIEAINSTDAPSGQSGQPLQVMLANVSENVSLPPWVSKEYYFLPFSIPSGANAADSLYRIPTIGIGAQLECREVKESNSDLLFRWILSHDAMEANFTVSERLPDGTLIRCFSPNAFTGDNMPAPTEDTQVYLRGPPEGRKAVEFFIQPKSSYVSATRQEKFACPRMFIGGWVKSSITLGSQMSETLYGPTANITSVSIDPRFMMCKPRFYTANFDIDVDQKGHVLNYTRNSPLNQTVDELLAWSIWNATTFLVGSPPDYLIWHNDTVADDWFNLLLKKVSNSTWMLDPNSPFPDFSTMAELVNKVYQELFALTVQANEKYLARAQQGMSVVAKEIRKETRIFLSSTMFKIVEIILILDVIVAALLYLRLPKPFLYRMPTSIAVLISYFASSHLLQDLKKVEVRGNEFAKWLRQKGRVYGFGKYIGVDGEIHVGIERQPYLVPRDVTNSRKILRLRKTTISSDMI